MEREASTIAKKFIECLMEGQVMEFVVPNNDLEGDDCEETDGSGITRRLFQVDTARSYAQMMAVVAFQAELVATGRTVSLRDVYYSLKHLFNNQSECNKIVLDVGRLCGLKRHEMGVIATARGFVSGQLLFKFERAGEEVQWTHCCDSSNSNNRVMIGYQWMSTLNSSSSEEQLYLRLAPETACPRYLIVVEKEGIFHRLVEEGFTAVVPCILVTGCGYPDIATRALVRRLKDYFKDIEVVGLCDFNPHGLSLLMTYRFSSAGSSFEGSGLQVPLHWLGLRCSQIAEMRRRDSPASVAELPTITPLLQPLSTHDINKIQAMLRIPHLPREYAEELEAMLRGGVKCELEALYTFGLEFVCVFLETSLLTRDFL